MITTKYIPPFLKKNQDVQKEHTRKEHTRKEHTTKEHTTKEHIKINFKLTEELFPVLKNNNDNDNGNKTISKKKNKIIINYATILNPDLNIPSPLTNDDTHDDTNDADNNQPGWIYIRKNKSNGTIEYKYGPEVINDDLFYKYEKHLDTCNLRTRIARLQWDRDREIDHLGDLSYYYNKPNIRHELESARYDKTCIKRKKRNVMMVTSTHHIKNKEMKIMKKEECENEEKEDEEDSLSSDSNED
jgi:hypothetical protein